MTGIVRNISWLTIGNVTVKPVWFVFMTFVCWRALGGREYGVMVAAMALAIVVVNLVNLGTSEYSVREVARNRAAASLYFSNFFLLRATTTTIGLVLAVAIGFFLGYRDGDMVALIFAGCYAVAQSLTGLCHAYYHAFETFKYEAVSVISDKVLTVALGWALLIVEAKASWVLGGLALGMLLTMAGNMAWLSRRFAKFRPSLFDRGFLRRSLPQALPLGLAGVFVLVYYRTGSVLVEALAGEVPAGQYGLAYRFLEALVFLPTLVVAVFLPRLSRLFGERSFSDFRRLLALGGGFLLVSSVAVAAALALGAPAIIRLIDPTPEAAPAVLALQILAWSFPFSSLAYLLVTALTAMDEQASLAWMLGLAAAFNVGLNAALIPAYSLYGACFATLFTQGLLVLAMVWRYFNVTLDGPPGVAEPDQRSDPAFIGTR